MRSLKTAVLLFVVAIVFGSCATQLRCAERFPCTPVDTVTVENTVYHDTTIFVNVPPVTVTDSIKIMLPCPDVTAKMSTDTVRVKSELATAEAWIYKNSLNVRLKIDAKRLEFKIDSAIKMNEKTVTIYKEVTVEKKVIPPFYRATLYVSIILIVLFIAIIYLALRV